MPSNPHSLLPSYVEESAPPPLPARKNHSQFPGLLQSPTSPQIFPISPRSSPRHTPRSSPLVSPNLSPENSPHASPRFHRHRNEPLNLLGQDESTPPPKLPARSKTKQSRNKDHMDNPFDAAKHLVDGDTQGRFPYAGVELSENKRSAQSEQRIPARTNYAELHFPRERDGEEQGERSHVQVGPRLSLNDQELEDYYDTPRTDFATNQKTTSSEDNVNLDNNGFFVHEDPFEGFNPFSGEKVEHATAVVQRNGQSGNIDDQLLLADQVPLPPRVPAPFSNRTTKSMDDLSIGSNENKDTDDDNDVEDMGTNPLNRPILPRCFSNPTYGSNVDFKASLKTGSTSNTLPALSHGAPVADTHETVQSSMEFCEEDFQILMGQGYSREEIKRALIIADNNFAMARKILREYHGSRIPKE